MIMAEKISKLFSAEDLKRITAAVNAAEGQTSGEIVPYVVERSEAYEAALWRGGFALSGLAWLGVALWYQWGTTWTALGLVEILSGLVLAQGGGMLLVLFIPPLKRFFAGQAALAAAVQREAQAAFLAEEIFKTRERTGILLFLSLFEKRVVALGDAGINAKVAPQEWEEVVQTIVSGMHRGQPAEGLLSAIQQCGALLQKQGVLRRGDDGDELANTLRMRRDGI